MCTLQFKCLSKHTIWLVSGSKYTLYRLHEKDWRTILNMQHINKVHMKDNTLQTKCKSLYSLQFYFMKTHYTFSVHQQIVIQPIGVKFACINGL